jgi:uncharacterized protein YfbU (UPF0304 family)
VENRGVQPKVGQKMEEMVEMPSFNITPLERLMLANQFRILTKVDPDYARYHRLDEKIEILEQGFEGDYGFILEGVSENRLSPDNCQLVRDIMIMTSTMLDLKGKTNIDLGEYDQVGFDSHSEGEYASYAEFLLKRNPAGYPGISDVVDVHHPMVDRYKKMVVAWRKTARPSRLNEGDVARIITSGNIR